MRSKWFNFGLWTFLAVMLVVAVDSCAPMRSAESSGEGEWMAFGDKVFSRQAEFRITDVIVYPKKERSGFDPSTSGSDQKLTQNRCTACHTCSFGVAFDWANYGNKDWSPQYRGDEWQPVIRRMLEKQSSFLQEETIVTRIYNFLKESTTGTYDEEDDIGARQASIDITEEEAEQMFGSSITSSDQEPAIH